MKLKKIFLLFVSLFIVNCFSIFAVENENSAEVEQEITQVEQEVPQKSEKDFIITNNSTQENSNNTARRSSAWAFVRMILTLICVVLIIYFLMKLFKKSGKINSGATDAYLRKVGHLNLSPGKSVQVVTLLDNCYVLGVTDNNINLIGTIEDKELISAMNLSADKNDKSSKPKTFGEVLEMFMPSKSTQQTSATKTNIYSASSENLTDFVKTQRTRMAKKKDETKNK